MFARVAQALPVADHARFYILYGEGVEDVFVNNNYDELNIEQAIQTELKSQGYRRIVFSAPHRPIFFLDQQSESLTWNPSPQTNRASSNGVRTVEMTVTEKGFEPSKIKAKKGEKLRLVVTRKTKSTCATEIVVPEHGINKELPLDEAVTVEVTPKKSGEIRYACGMGHVTGIVFVP